MGAKSRSVAASLAALALGIVLGLIVLESLVRLLGHQRRFQSTRIEERHKAPFTRPADRALPEPGSGPPFRILVVGDSFTWGGGVLVEDSYPWRLERRLWAASLPVRIEVKVLSRPGWAAADEARALKVRWRDLSPDLLLVGYVLNDPLPAPGVEQEALREPLQHRFPQQGPGRWLYRHSYLFDLVWDRLENTRQRHAFRAHYELLHDPEYRGWQRARVALGSMARLAAADGVPAVLAIFPVFDFERLDEYAYADIHRRVQRAARGRGFRVLDLLPAYRGVEGRRLAVEPFTDAHPSELAHRIAAQAIADFLMKNQLVPTGEVETETPAADVP